VFCGPTVLYTQEHERSIYKCTRFTMGIHSWYVVLMIQLMCSILKWENLFWGINGPFCESLHCCHWWNYFINLFFQISNRIYIYIYIYIYTILMNQTTKLAMLPQRLKNLWVGPWYISLECCCHYQPLVYIFLSICTFKLLYSFLLLLFQSIHGDEAWCVSLYCCQ